MSKNNVESLPTVIEIEKEGEETRLFNAATGQEIEGCIAVKLDMSAGKPCKAKLTFEVKVTEIRVIEKQLKLLDANVTFQKPS